MTLFMSNKRFFAGLTAPVQITGLTAIVTFFKANRPEAGVNYREFIPPYKNLFVRIAAALFPKRVVAYPLDLKLDNSGSNYFVTEEGHLATVVTDKKNRQSIDVRSGFMDEWLIEILEKAIRKRRRELGI